MTFSDDDYEPVMRSLRTAAIFASIQGCAKKMGVWLAAGTVDVVVFEKVAHLESIELFQSGLADRICIASGDATKKEVEDIGYKE